MLTSELKGRRRSRVLSAGAGFVLGCGVLVLGLADRATQVGEPPASIAPPTNSGPRGAPHFCMAPPVPQRKEPPPAPEFAPPLRDYRLNPTQARNLFADEDTSNVLFILAAFADVPFDTSGVDTVGIGGSDVTYDRDTILHEFFERQLGYVREYYSDVSYGQHVFLPTVHADIVTLPEPMAYYGNDDKFGERGTRLIWDAVRAVDDVVDFGVYDGFTIIHSDGGQESDVSNDSKDQIWSAFFPQPLLADVMEDSLGYAVPGIPTNDFTAEGDTVYVEGSALLPETESQDGFNFGLMGVYTHELGHVMLGWPDLYDTTGDTPSQGIGSFCLMAAGTWNANGNVPGEPSAWCRMYAGWTTPQLVDPVGGAIETVTLTYIEKDEPDPGDVMLARIPISGDEYFLVACHDPDVDDDEAFDWDAADPADPLFRFWTNSYAGAEFDFFLPNEIPDSPTGTYKEPNGLSIWHIDESVVTFGFPFNIVNGDPRHHGIDLEEADGVQDLEFPAYTILSFGGPQDLWRGGEADSFSTTTEPNTQPTFGGPANVVIRNISDAAPAMTFEVTRTDDDATPGAPALRDGWPITLPGPITVAQPLAVDVVGSGADQIVLLDDEGSLRVMGPDGSLQGLLTVGPPIVSPSYGRALNLSVGALVGARADGSVWATESLGTLDTVFVHPQLSSEGFLTDIDADGLDEYVIGSRDAIEDSMITPGRLHVVHVDIGSVDTFELERAPTGAGAALEGARVVFPLLDGGLGIVDVDSGEFHMLDAAVMFGPPAVGDLDRDGLLDMVAHGDDGRLHAYEYRGSMTPTWTAPLGGAPRGEVSIADVDSDGYLDIAALGTSGSIYVYNYNGVAKPGWPVFQDVAQEVFFDFAAPAPGPLAADIDGDDGLDLLPVFGDGRVDAFDVTSSAARRIDGVSFQAGPGSVPVVGDFDGDGEGELFLLESVQDRFGNELWNRATMWDLGAAYEDRADAWTMYRGGPARRGSSAGSANDLATQDALVADVYCQPNPAGPAGTRVHYRLSGAAETVRVEFYDVAGQFVNSVWGPAAAGVDNLVRWDGTREGGGRAAPGLYVYRVTARGGGRSEAVVGKVALIR